MTELRRIGAGVEPTIAQIQRRTAEAFGVHLRSMTSRQRARKLSWPRQGAMYLCSKLTEHSLPTIAKHFGDRDHTTVMHAVKAVSRRLLQRSNHEFSKRLRSTEIALQTDMLNGTRSERRLILWHAFAEVMTRKLENEAALSREEARRA